MCDQPSQTTRCVRASCSITRRIFRRDSSRASGDSITSPGNSPAHRARGCPESCTARGLEPVGETPTAPYPQPYPQAPYPQQPYPQQPPAYQQPPASAATPPSVPCTGYGAPPSYYVGVGVPQVANRLATTSLVIGIVSVVVSLACCSLLSVFGIAAIVCGVVARRQIAASLGYQTGAGLALAGIITGAIAVLIGTGMFLLLFAVSPGSLS